MTTPFPQGLVRYVDKDGKLTPEGLAYFLELARKVRDLEERLDTLEG